MRNSAIAASGLRKAYGHKIVLDGIDLDVPAGTVFSLLDVTSGNNALFDTPEQTCGDDYLCTAKKGYDAPAGLGTPDGTGAF